ncbi:MAG: response regulator [Thermoplasmatota archaeon]
MESPADQAARRVLVVDDEPEIRQAVRRLLQRMPEFRVNVDEAPNGEEAITLLRRHPYSIVVSDYRMGRVSGVDVLEIARIEQPAAVRVLMTAYEDMEIAREAVNRARIEGLVRKPWENDKFLALMERLSAEHTPNAA